MTPANTHGILLLDKPPGESSFQALYPVKRAFGGKKGGTKVGHAGTLDPAASGLLVVGVGAGTRLLEFLEEMPKAYRFTLRLGLVTDTYDLDGEVTERHDASAVTRADVEALLPEFTGDILQTPPEYSAIKIAGKRACDRARAGETVTLEPRGVRVHRLALTAFEPGAAELEMECSKGTYVRTIAHDLGRRLGCGAVADRIRRTAVGPFRVENATPPHAPSPLGGELKGEAGGSNAPDFLGALLPLERAVDNLPSLRLKESHLAALRNGNPVPAAGYVVRTPAKNDTGDDFALLSPKDALIAVGAVDPLGWFRPRKVFQTAD